MSVSMWFMSRGINQTQSHYSHQNCPLTSLSNRHWEGKNVISRVKEPKLPPKHPSENQKMLEGGNPGYKVNRRKIMQVLISFLVKKIKIYANQDHLFHYCILLSNKHHSSVQTRRFSCSIYIIQWHVKIDPDGWNWFSVIEEVLSSTIS